jgi:hypothetical protein
MCVLKSKDNKTVRLFNKERKIAYKSAWEYFAPNYNKKYDTDCPFEFCGGFNPPLVAICNHTTLHNDEQLDNCYKVYKFVNGKWELCGNKVLRNSLWGYIDKRSICKEFNCNRCVDYLYFDKSAEKLKYKY